MSAGRRRASRMCPSAGDNVKAHTTLVLPIGVRRNFGSHRTEPSFKPLSDGQLVRIVRVPVVVDQAQQPAQLALGVALSAAECRRHRLAASAVAELERARGALANMAAHKGFPPKISTV